jgi:hypothetical protein
MVSSATGYTLGRYVDLTHVHPEILAAITAMVLPPGRSSRFVGLLRVAERVRRTTMTQARSHDVPCNREATRAAARPDDPVSSAQAARWRARRTGRDLRLTSSAGRVPVVLSRIPPGPRLPVYPLLRRVIPITGEIPETTGATP